MENTDEKAQRDRNRRAAQGAVMAAEALLEEGDAPRALFTDSDSVPGYVVIGVALRGRAGAALVVKRSEYDGFAVLAELQALAAS